LLKNRNIEFQKNFTRKKAQSNSCNGALSLRQNVHEIRFEAPLDLDENSSKRFFSNKKNGSWSTTKRVRINPETIKTK